MATQDSEVLELTHLLPTSFEGEVTWHRAVRCSSWSARTHARVPRDETDRNLVNNKLPKYANLGSWQCRGRLSLSHAAKLVNNSIGLGVFFKSGVHIPGLKDQGSSPGETSDVLSPEMLHSSTGESVWEVLCLKSG
jgi:hypothetical protein